MLLLLTNINYVPYFLEKHNSPKGGTGQLHQIFRPLKIKRLRDTESSLSAFVFEAVSVT